MIWVIVGVLFALSLQSDRSARFAQWQSRYYAYMSDPAHNRDPGGWSEDWRP